MDFDRMLAKCRREQWRVADLDWSVAPADLPREKEIAVVQYFTDMSEIERLAGALFDEQRKRAEDPVLAEILGTFVRDELRHAHVARRLADHYDVHRYRYYQVNPHLRRFAPYFVDAVRYLSAEVATVYITTGELILDVALLRSLNDYVDDPMSQQAMDRINRDESRHIAIDYQMVQYYASDDYQDWLARQPRQPMGERIRAWWAFANVLRTARPFFREVFFAPMERTDPTGKRIKEAFKRVQLLAAKPSVRKRPFPRFILTLQAAYQNPFLGALLGRVIRRILGLDGDLLETLYSEKEYARAERQSFDELARDALRAKLA